MKKCCLVLLGTVFAVLVVPFLAFCLLYTDVIAFNREHLPDYALQILPEEFSYLSGTHDVDLGKVEFYFSASKDSDVIDTILTRAKLHEWNVIFANDKKVQIKKNIQYGEKVLRTNFICEKFKENDEDIEYKCCF